MERESVETMCFWRVGIEDDSVLTLAAPRFSIVAICNPRRSSCRSLSGFKDDLEYAMSSGVNFIVGGRRRRPCLFGP